MNDSQIELCKYRFEKSKECINSARILRDAGDYRGAANRAYYAIYHAIRSILALETVEFKKHSGNISYFRQNYIKTGLFDVELSDILSLAAETRNSSDYNDFFIISKEEVDVQIENAERFCDDVKRYLSDRTVIL